MADGTKWEGAAPGEETWEPAQHFVKKYCVEVPRYLKTHGLDVGMALLSKEEGERVLGV